MNFMRIAVPDRLIERCWDHGEQIVDSYKSGNNERSRKVGCKERPIAEDLTAQRMGKLYEVAAALALNLNPDDDLHWGNHADPGWDFLFHSLKVDVKGSCHPNAHYLIWPNSKTHFYAEAPHDLLIFVHAEPAESLFLGQCEVRGWITKKQFEIKKCIAAGLHIDRFETGTWFLHESKLEPIRTLFEAKAA